MADFVNAHIPSRDLRSGSGCDRYGLVGSAGPSTIVTRLAQPVSGPVPREPLWRDHESYESTPHRLLGHQCSHTLGRRTK